MSEVKRWRIPKILYPCYAPVSETDEVVPAAAYDALKREYNDLKHNRDGWMRSCNDWRARTKEAEDRIVDLGNRLLKTEAARDNAVANVQDVCNKWQADLDGRIRAEAERDKLAGMVAVARGLYRHSFNGYKWIRADHVDAILAEPVEETFQRLNSFGVPYESRNGRGLIGHDARGRRQYDPRSIIYTGSDRRRAQRRKA